MLLNTPSHPPTNQSNKRKFVSVEIQMMLIPQAAFNMDVAVGISTQNMYCDSANNSLPRKAWCDVNNEELYSKLCTMITFDFMLTIIIIGIGVAMILNRINKD